MHLQPQYLETACQWPIPWHKAQLHVQQADPGEVLMQPNLNPALSGAQNPCRMPPSTSA